jgi:hypothetical protein
VPQEIGGEAGKAGLFEQRLEAPMVKVVGVYRLPVLIREHQTPIFPEGAKPQPFLVLAGAVALEGFRGLCSELDGSAALVALGRVESSVLL